MSNSSSHSDRNQSAIIKTKLSDEKTIQAIQENPYMQYLLGLEKFTEKPVFVPELFVLVRKRLDHDFFNMLTLMLAETDGSKPKKEHTDETYYQNIVEANDGKGYGWNRIEIKNIRSTKGSIRYGVSTKSSFTGSTFAGQWVSAADFNLK